jgi:hypothetical protein
MILATLDKVYTLLVVVLGYGIKELVQKICDIIG